MISFLKRIMSIKIIILFLCLFLFPALIYAKETVKAGQVDYTFEPLLSHEWVCYVQNGELFIRNIKIQPYRVRSGKEASGAIINPAIQVIDGIIYVIWIERGQGENKVFLSSLPVKNLSENYVRIIASTKAQFINYFIDINKKIYIVENQYDKGGDGFLHIVDLTPSLKSALQKIPFTFNDLDSVYNYAFLSKNGSIYIFFAGIKDEKHFLGNMSFGASDKEIKKTEKIINTGIVSFMEAVKVKDKVVLIYKTSREGVFVLEGLSEKEKEWDSFSVKGTEGMDIARLDSYSWDDGRLLIVYSGEEKGNFKQRIFSAITEDYGKNWQVTRLDNKEFDNTRSWLPRIAVAGNNAAVVWEDSRNIRSGIRLKLSADRGNTWMKKDILISDDRKISFRPRINFSKKDFYISWLQFIDDEKMKGELVLTKIGWNEAVHASLKKEKIPSLNRKEVLLKQRVNAYWNAMIRKDIKTVYQIHDPFYRARIPFEYFSSHRGPMVYHNYSIEGIRIEGNIASVKIKVKYEVPKFIIQGKESSIPPKEVVAEDTYLFLDGKWFRKFVDVLSDGSAIDY